METQKKQSSFEYFIACKETGDKIDSFDTYKEAKFELLAYEKADKIEGIFVEDFYEIIKIKK